jgi:hypothetical protein
MLKVNRNDFQEVKQFRFLGYGFVEYEESRDAGK